MENDPSFLGNAPFIPGNCGFIPGNVPFIPGNVPLFQEMVWGNGPFTVEMVKFQWHIYLENDLEMVH